MLEYHHESIIIIIICHHGQTSGTQGANNLNAVNKQLVCRNAPTVGIRCPQCGHMPGILGVLFLVNKTAAPHGYRNFIRTFVDTITFYTHT